MANLITKDDFVGIIDIAKNFRDNRFDPYTAAAERLDLRPLMGEFFYYDFIQNLAESNYQTLFNGGTYTCGGKTADFAGLKFVIVYFTHARLLNNSDTFATATGGKIKTADNSEPISERTRARIINEVKSSALSYWQECEKYLNENKTLFPEWNCSGTKRTGIKIRSIG